MKPFNSHLIVPLTLSNLALTSDSHAAAVELLDRILARAGAHATDQGSGLAVGVFGSPESAKDRSAAVDDKVKIGRIPKHFNADSVVWVGLLAHESSMLPAVLHRGTFQDPEFATKLLDACKAAEADADLQALAALVPNCTSGQQLLRSVLLDLALWELHDDMLGEIPTSASTEYVDVADRGYVVSPFDVDPVETLLSDPYALQNAATEANVHMFASNDGQIRMQAMAEWEKVEQDLEPVITTLGYRLDQVPQWLEDFIDNEIAEEPTLELELRGEVSIAAQPCNGKSSLYISFDGVSSSSMNAVVDDDYLAMLDQLRVHPRAWVDYLAVRAGLEAPQWDFDVQQVVEQHRSLARFDPDSGFHFESKAVRDALRESFMEALFGRPPEELQDTASYLFDIALEVIKARAEALDGQWLDASGIDVEALGEIMSSREQLQQFPALVNRPGFYMAVTNLSEGSSASHEWSFPLTGDQTPAAIIEHDRLASVLDNANYDGSVVIAFCCDLDDLQKIGAAAAQADEPKTVEVRDAYFHIHNYSSGAGDGESLSGNWSFSTADLAEGRLRLRNDATDSYGIAGVFGEFLASGSSIAIKAPAVEITTVPEADSSPQLG